MSICLPVYKIENMYYDVFQIILISTWNLLDDKIA